MNDKSLPCDLQAEQATLGSIFLDRDAILPVAPWLKAEYFFMQKHAWIYEAQAACTNRRIPPDLVNVTDELRRRERLDAVGGPAYLNSLSNSVPTACHVEYYGRIVERTALMRGLIQAGSKIVKLGFDDAEDFSDTLDQAEGLLSSLAQRKHDAAISFEDLAVRYESRLTTRRDRQETLTGISTGFASFDALTGGLQPSDLLILAARPAVGKTSLALNIAEHAAREGQRVAIFSLEMGSDQLMERMLSSATGIDMQVLRSGQISDDLLPRLYDALGVLSALPITVIDSGSLTAMDIRSQCRQLANDGGLDLVVIDYLQLMQGNVSRRADANRVQEVSEISRSLKLLARELNIPVLALSQLSRAVENRTSKVPMLSDLRESGSLEQDADIVLFIYREELYDPETDKKGMAELHIAKHRNGPTGVVPLRFFRSTTRFANLETYRQVEGY